MSSTFRLVWSAYPAYLSVVLQGYSAFEDLLNVGHVHDYLSYGLSPPTPGFSAALWGLVIALSESLQNALLLSGRHSWGRRPSMEQG